MTCRERIENFKELLKKRLKREEKQKRKTVRIGYKKLEFKDKKFRWNEEAKIVEMKQIGKKI